MKVEIRASYLHLSGNHGHEDDRHDTLEHPIKSADVPSNLFGTKPKCQRPNLAKTEADWEDLAS